MGLRTRNSDQKIPFTARCRSSPAALLAFQLHNRIPVGRSDAATSSWGGPQRSTRADRKDTERPLGRDRPEQLHLPPRRRRFGDPRCRLAQHAGPAQLDLHLRHVPSPIEYRFPHTTGIVIANNVLDGGVQARDGAAGSVSGNHTTGTAALFVNAATGDLHHRPTATALLNRIVTPLVNAAVDWDGHARPAGRTDVGADEFPEGATTPPSPPTGLRIVR